MKSDEINAQIKAVINSPRGDGWCPTMYLRWFDYFEPKPGYVGVGTRLHKLQQLWSDGFNKTEWRDIETAAE